MASAWMVLRLMSGSSSKEVVPARLRRRVRSLADRPVPRRTLTSWMTGRGTPVRLAGGLGVVLRMQVDVRLVLSGDRAVRGVAPRRPLVAYIGHDDLARVVDEYRLQIQPDHLLPDVVLWEVEDLSAVPRNPPDPHCAAALVAALDLASSDADDAIAASERILAAAIDASATLDRPKASGPRSTYADRRPRVVVNDLATLRGASTGIVELPVRLDWCHRGT